MGDGMPPKGSASSLPAVEFDKSSEVPSGQQLCDALSQQAVRVIDLFRDWDDDGDGQVSKKELALTLTLALTLALNPSPVPNPAPNPNQVSKKEFRKAMSALGLNVPRKEADGLFDTFDPDGGGSIAANPNS